MVIYNQKRKESMKDLKDEKEFLSSLMDMLEQQMGPYTEVVLHDLKKDYATTIVDIRNGHITGRQVGGTGSNLGLEVLQGTVKDGNRFNYVTRLKDNRLLRSSSLYIKDDEGNLIGCLCVNTDITESVKLESFLRSVNQYDINTSDNQEVFVTEVNQLLEYLLQEGQKLVGKPACLMDKEEKLQFLKYLNDKGAFLITKSGERIQSFLKISKYTMYSYLDMIKKEEAKSKTE